MDLKSTGLDSPVQTTWGVSSDALHADSFCYTAGWAPESTPKSLCSNIELLALCWILNWVPWVPCSPELIVYIPSARAIGWALHTWSAHCDIFVLIMREIICNDQLSWSGPAA